MRRVRETHAFGSPSTSSWGRKASATAGRRSRCLRVQSARSNPRRGASVPSEGLEDPDPSVAPWAGIWAGPIPTGATGGMRGFTGAGGGAADGPLRLRRVSTDVASARSPTPTDSSGGLSCDRWCLSRVRLRPAERATSPSGGVTSSGATSGSAMETSPSRKGGAGLGSSDVLEFPCVRGESTLTLTRARRDPRSDLKSTIHEDTMHAATAKSPSSISWMERLMRRAWGHQ